jgi:tetratricopeptide (TPR) repeat protein
LASGKIDPQEALEIARQLCAGLAEAHRIGVIHKDLKSANVILCRVPDGTIRAVITDFGLAGERSLESGDLAGTPQYMAPELWLGTPASAASDIYALGVILYEMIAGEKPFADARSQRLLTPRPSPPSLHARNIDKRWDAAVAKCLDPSPDARPRDAMEVLRLLEARAVPKKSIAIAAAVLLVGGLAMRGPLIKFFNPPSIRLAILPIEGSDVNAIGDGALIDVADRLGRRSGAPTVAVIPASRSLDANVHTPLQALQILGATHALQVSLRRDGNDLIARGAVILLGTQTRLQEISGRYSIANAGDLPVAITGAVTKALHLRGVESEAISHAAAAPYLQGLAFLRRDQHSFDSAIPLFRRAIASDAHSPLPKAGLAEALVLKYGDTKDAQSIAEADRTLRSAETLNPDSVAVLLAKGRLEAANGHYEAALNCYRRVAEIQPRNLEVVLRIADMNGLLGLPAEAIQSYRNAIALDPAYYESYEEFGSFLFHRGEYSKAADQFRKVIQLAPKFYNAYANLGSTSTYMGRDEEAEKALIASLKIKENAGALNSLAALRAYQRRDVEAVALYKRALVLDPSSHVFLLNLGDSSRRLGLAQDALAYYEKGSVIALEQVNANPRDGAARAYLASFAARLGDRARAEAEIAQALQLSPGDKTVIRRAVLTFEALDQRDKAMAVAATAPLDVLRELDRHPDLADFCRDTRFREVKAQKEKGG